MRILIGDAFSVWIDSFKFISFNWIVIIIVPIFTQYSSIMLIQQHMFHCSTHATYSSFWQVAAKDEADLIFFLSAPSRFQAELALEPPFPRLTGGDFLFQSFVLVNQLPELVFQVLDGV